MGGQRHGQHRPLRREESDLLGGDRRPHADPPQRGIPGHHRHRAARDSRGGRLDGGAEVAGVREQVLRRQQAPPKGRPEGREGRHRVRAGDERHAPDAAHLRRAGLLHLHGGPCRLRRVLHLAGASAHGQARPLHEGAHPREAHLERWPRQREAHAPGPLHGDPAGLLRGGRLQRAHRQRHQPSRRAPPRHQQGAGPRGQDARGLPGPELAAQSGIRDGRQALLAAAGRLRGRGRGKGAGAPAELRAAPQPRDQCHGGPPVQRAAHGVLHGLQAGARVDTRHALLPKVLHHLRGW
mmetsp:Transcript_45201/g.119757  ORF Transcript_45201/g.119757 Transcript_45201/m.119757 type:complete len:295 (+) Transcript_45201:489-1373(+)